MNTLKKFVAIIIILTLIVFFVNSFLEIKRKEPFMDKIADNLRHAITGEHNDNEVEDVEVDTCLPIEDSVPNVDGTHMYTYEGDLNLSEYILKTELPVAPNMTKYILKTKVESCKKPIDKLIKEGEKIVKEGEKVVKKVAKPVKKVVKKTVKPVKKAAKPVKKVAKKVAKPVAKPVKKVANELNNVVKTPQPIVPDRETRDKIERSPDRDLVNKANVSKLGKNTENGNEILFQFNKILPTNLTYKNPNRCIHSELRNDDNTNTVESENVVDKVKNWFGKLF